MMKTYSTREAAKMLGIGMMTLNRYIAAGKIAVPPVQHIGGTCFRAWTVSDVERVKKMLPNLKNGRTQRKKRRADMKHTKEGRKK
jgi:excisionase family DNA binding protein